MIYGAVAGAWRFRQRAGMGNTVPSWVPSDALAHLDYREQRYFANDAVWAIETMHGGGFDADYISSAGMRIRFPSLGGTNLPDAAGPLLSIMHDGLTVGLTGVIEWTITADEDNIHYTSPHLFWHDDTWNDWLEVGVNNSGVVINDGYDLLLTGAAGDLNALGAVQRMAFTICRDVGGGDFQFAASLNGGTAVTQTIGYGFAWMSTDQAPLFQRWDLWTQAPLDNHIREMTLYAAQEPSALPALSTIA
jgi:hypothetical protein